MTYTVKLCASCPYSPALLGAAYDPKAEQFCCAQCELPQDAPETRVRRPWTPEDLNVLRSMYLRGFGDVRIALELDRSLNAVGFRRREMRLFYREPEKIKQAA